MTATTWGINEDPTGGGILIGTGQEGGGTPGGTGTGTGYDPYAKAANLREFGTMVQILSEGPLEGLVDGLKSVRIEGTPVQNADGSFNFGGVAMALVLGTNTQAHIPGLSSSELEVAVGVQLKVSTGSITRTVSTSGISGIRVRVAVPQLYKMDPTTGKRDGMDTQIKVERQSPNYTPVGGVLGDWEQVLLEGGGWIWGGPFDSKYTKSWRIDTPTAGPWSIRLTRVFPDAPDNYTKNDTIWEAYTEIFDGKMRTPGVAKLVVRLDSKQFRTVPKVTVIAKGVRIEVPANYDPIARTYATTGPGTTMGIWDGTFKLAWTNNPAWIWYTVATNRIWGAGKTLAGKVDKFALYEIAQSCDELVSDGKGGQEPRFQCSIYLQNQEDALKVLSDLASCFRSMAYGAGGTVSVVQDAPKSRSALFSNSNIRTGRFSYSGTARKARHNAALVSWIDPNNGYQTSVEYVQDRDAIVRYGYNPIRVPALGAPTQGQAHRHGEMILLTEKLETESIGFTSGLEGVRLRPGALFGIRDQFRLGKGRNGGRMVSGTTTTVGLDGDVVLEAGTTYELTVYLPTLGVQTRTVTTPPGTWRVLSVGVAFSEVPEAHAQWALAPVGQPMDYTAISIRKGGGLDYEITGIQHDETKFALADAVSVTTAPPRSTPALVLPTTLTLSDSVRVEKDKLVQVLSASWVGDSQGYQAEASQNKGPWWKMSVTGAGAVLEGITSGDWRVRVKGLHAAGETLWVDATRTVAPPTQMATDVAAAQAILDAASLDSKITNLERPVLRNLRASLASRVTSAKAQADAMVPAVTHAALDTAWTTFTTNVDPILAATTDSTITKATWDGWWSAVDAAITDLAGVMSRQAQTAANAAQAILDAASLDGKITNLERPALRNLRASLASRVTSAKAQADAMVPAVTHAALDTAWTTFTANVDPILAATTDSTIVKATWDGWWSAVDSAITDLAGVMSRQAQSAATYADTLARSNFNLIKNSSTVNTTPPTGTPEAAGVSATGATSAFSPSGYARQAVCDGTGAAKLYLSDYIPCVGGDQFYFSGQGAHGGGAVHGTMTMAMEFYGATKTLAGSPITSAAGTSIDTNAPSTMTVSTSSTGAPTGACFVRFYARQDGAATGNYIWVNNFYASRKTPFGVLQGDAVQTSDWAPTGGVGGGPIGTRMAVGVSGQPGLVTSAAGIQIGTSTMDQYLLARMAQGMDGTTALGRVWYRGNCDTSVRSGTPFIDRLTVTRRQWNTTLKSCRLELSIQPNQADDNLDAMRSAKIQLYRQSAAGTTGTLTAVGEPQYPQFNDRRYVAPDTDSTTTNANQMTFPCVDPGISSGFPAALIVLKNVNGDSAAHCFYSAAGNADGSVLTDNGMDWTGTSLTGGSSGGSASGGGGSGYCPAPWVEIELASGLMVMAGDLYDGAQVLGFDDDSFVPKIGTIRRPHVEWQLRSVVAMEDGRTPEFSVGERMAVDGRGWVAVRDLRPGDEIIGRLAGRVKAIGKPFMSRVVAFAVEGCNTYYGAGLACHNMKIQ